MQLGWRARRLVAVRWAKLLAHGGRAIEWSCGTGAPLGRREMLARLARGVPLTRAGDSIRIIRIWTAAGYYRFARCA